MALWRCSIGAWMKKIQLWEPTPNTPLGCKMSAGTQHWTASCCQLGMNLTHEVFSFLLIFIIHYSLDGQVKIWDLRGSDNAVKTWELHANGLSAFDVHPSAGVFASWVTPVSIQVNTRIWTTWQIFIDNSNVLEIPAYYRKLFTPIHSTLRVQRFDWTHTSSCASSPLTIYSKVHLISFPSHWNALRSGWTWWYWYVHLTVIFCHNINIIVQFESWGARSLEPYIL